MKAVCSVFIRFVDDTIINSDNYFQIILMFSKAYETCRKVMYLINKPLKKVVHIHTILIGHSHLPGS